MPDKVQYEFAIIRVMPQVERGETINVGVVVFSKKLDYIGIKYQVDIERLSALSKDLDIEELHSYLKAWESIAKARPESGKIGTLVTAERFRWLTAAKSTILQCSEVHPGLSVSPERVLEKLFAKYVL